jgi:alkanesulfonate monooxygenase SsuD/methylene tetrahydromethanopterin reductase-like flavin-dependent oxidoreductase (luciferase family)
VLEKPYAMVGAGVFAAHSDAEAKRLFSSAQLQFLNLLRGTPGELNPPIDDIELLWSPQEKQQIACTLACAIVGAPATIKQGLQTLIAETQADELIVTAQIYDHAARLHSYELLAEVRNSL